MDTNLQLRSETTSYRSDFTGEKYSGPCAFFTAYDTNDFMKLLGLDGCSHPDGVYGWSQVLDNPGRQEPQLTTRHIAIFATEEATRRVAEALILFQ